MKIVVLDGHTLNPGDNPWDDIARLGDLTVYARTRVEEVVKKCEEAEVLLTNKTPISRETLSQLPRLRFIAVLATGYNVVDVAAAREAAIPVSNVPTYGTDSVAQHTVALILELAHRVGLHDASVKAGEWNESPDFCYWKSSLVELRGKVLGIIGYGKIGQRVGSMAQAFGMRVIYFRRPGSERIHADAIGTSLEDLAKEADVITLHCALTAENARFINRGFLSRCKSTAFLVNTSRGALIDDSDLFEALRAGTIAGAALDVLCQEPPTGDNPLLGAPNCIITPHMAWTGLGARKSLMSTTVENIRAYMKGRPINVVNA